MNYNLFAKSVAAGFNILDLPEDKLPIIIDAFHKGENEFTIKGKTYNWGRPKEVKIFKNISELDEEQISDFCQNDSGWVWVFGAGHLISPNTLRKLGDDVTNELLGDIPFGSNNTTRRIERNDSFVDKKRLMQLKGIKSNNYDLSRLIKLCEEINHNWRFENTISVGLLLRSIINYVPPIFDNSFKTFDNLISNYSASRSFKDNMKHLNTALRTIADGYNHGLISSKEDLPTAIQVDFRQSFDLLLGEIIKVLS